ncbi:MAG: hypothetical protein ACHQRM_09925 [Bacteroidia bacterium]
MTSVVGILNREAVAIAADSAVTLGNGKIFNRALKIFTLSKYHPIGVMIYNSANFMVTPWATIIKMYREQLGDKAHPTVRKYQEDFIAFLHQKNFFSSPDFQKNYFSDVIKSLFFGINDLAFKGNENILTQATPENLVKRVELLNLEIDKYLKNWEPIPTTCPEFVTYSYEDFLKYINNTYEAAVKEVYTDHGTNLSKEVSDKFKKYFYNVIIKTGAYPSYTGIVFVGFGEDEIYPALVPITVYLAFDNKLKFFVDENSARAITDTNATGICPFGQTEAIDTILTGVSPKLEETYSQNFVKFFEKYNKEIIKHTKDPGGVISGYFAGINLNDLKNEYIKDVIEAKQQNYIFPLFNAVASLSKEDLAEMAQSLIHLTFLQKRITSAQEDVGGDVDVAIISKGDGFIWIKRKHYFSRELNEHFFMNYFNNRNSK